MIIEAGFANVEIIERGLRHLFRDVPKWVIKKMSDENEFMISFPNEDLRHQCSRFRGFEFETADVKARVIPTDLSPEADGKLEVLWVKGFNFSPDARKEDIVMEVAYIVGDPIEVDLKSLDSHGPIRVKVACREALKIRGETRVYFNGEGYAIRWEPELLKAVVEEPKSSKFDRQKDRDDDGDFEEEEEERDQNPAMGHEACFPSFKEGGSTQGGNSGKGGSSSFKQADINFC
jgi:hypothetical protein